MVDAEYIWAVAQARIDDDAVAVLGAVPPAQGESPTSTATWSDGTATLGTATGIGESPTCAATWSDGTATVSQLDAVTGVVDATTDSPTSLATIFPEPTATVGTNSALGESPTCAATIEETATGSVVDGYTAEVTDIVRSVATVGDARGTVRNRGSVQKGEVSRVRRITTIEDFANPAMVLHMGQALTRSYGVAVPLQAGEAFLGFAAEYSDPRENSLFVVTDGQARIEVQGVSSQAQAGQVVYALNDTTFTLTEVPGSDIGIVANWVSGRWCLVNFQGIGQRSIS